MHPPGIVQAVASNSTSPIVPLSVYDGSTRSIWGILGSCALTLLICVWHAIHLNITTASSEDSWTTSSVAYVLAAFFAPEFAIAYALLEWWTAREQVIAFRRRGYEWSMTHSFFAEMGGFTYRNEKGEIETIRSLKFLDLCEADKIANPVITVREIQDKSKSDWLAKAILVIQLFWFGLQIVVRAAHGLATTLLELDTVVMALLSLFVLWLWWKKPYHPQCPHMFYYLPSEVELYPRGASVLKNAWESEPSYLSKLSMKLFFRVHKERPADGEEKKALVASNVKSIRCLSDILVDSVDGENTSGFAFVIVWMVLGGLHLIAWNFEFLTEAEKILWRVASLVLAGSPLPFMVLVGILPDGEMKDTFFYTLFTLGVIARTLLAALMLASFRLLPPSAYQTIPWTAYIPHL